MVEKAELGVADFVVIAIVLAISASIGIYFRFSGGRQRTTNEFLMAGRSMSPFPVVFSLIVTFVSAVMMIGIPGEVYQYGLYRMLAYICSTISNVASAYIFLPVYFEMGDSVSVYEYVERRFGVLTRKVSSVLFILQTVFYMAVVLVAPALALSSVCNIPQNTSIPVIGLICTAYCCMGGMKAVLWTDVFQAIIMYICIFAILIRGIALGDSIPFALKQLHSDNKETFFSFDPSIRYTLWNCVIYGFLYGLCNYGCNQAQIQRMLSVKSLKLSQRAVIASVPLAIIFIAINFFLGVVMYANYYCDKDPLRSRQITRRDQMVPYFIVNSFKEYPGMAGLCIAGIFSGALSTVSSSVNSLAAVTMEDFVAPYFATRWKISDGMAAFLVKAFACTYGLLGIASAFIVDGKGLIFVYTVVYGSISGPVLGLFTLGMMTISVKQKGAMMGLLSGILTTSCLGFMSNKKSSKVCNLNHCKNMTAPTYSTYSPNTTSFSQQISSTTENFPWNVTSFPSDLNASFSALFDNITTTLTATEDAINVTQEHNTSCKNEELVSIIWLLVIGFAVTVIVGHLSSYTQSRSRDQEKCDVDPALLSPLVRKWLLKSSTYNSPGHAEELMKLNGCTAEINKPNGSPLEGSVPTERTDL